MVLEGVSRILPRSLAICGAAMTIGEIHHGRQGTKSRNAIAETEAAFQRESPKELISPPEKKVPIKLPRVIGRSRCDGCDSS